MKRVKFYLPIGAVVMAVGLAFATSGQSDSFEKLYIQRPGECRQVTTECQGSGAVCTYFDEPVYGIQDSSTQCSMQLQRNP